MSKELEESVCIVDFCGGYRSPKYGYVNPVSFSADWFPAENLVYFTGLWHNVPVMPAATEPDEDAVTKWAESHVNFDAELDEAFRLDALRKEQ